MADFWAQIDRQVDMLHKAETVDEVLWILNGPFEEVKAEVNRNGPRTFGADSAFFAGSGGDRSVYGALVHAGWRTVWYRAGYWWCMEQPDGQDRLTYTEGDVERGNRYPLPEGEAAAT